MTLTHEETFEHYMYAGAIRRDPEAQAALFTEDGVYEAPLVPAGHPLPRRLAGQTAIQAGIGAFHAAAVSPGTVNPAESRFVLHDTADPDTFMVELDAVFDTPDGGRATTSLLQIFRLRDGRIALLRDYFTPPPA